MFGRDLLFKSCRLTGTQAAIFARENGWLSAQPATGRGKVRIPTHMLNFSLFQCYGVVTEC